MAFLLTYASIPWVNVSIALSIVNLLGFDKVKSKSTIAQVGTNPSPLHDIFSLFFESIITA